MSDDGIAGGLTVGRYRIQGRLEEDTVGEILKGFDPLLERPVVLKVFRADLSDAATKRTVADLFYREMQRAGVLVHPGIVQLFDAGECPAGLFMASEFIEGGSLADVVAADAPPDLDRALVVISQIVDGLEYAHALGVAHLNLKPTNVIVSPDRSVKLAGFGAARVIDAITAVAGGTPRAATRTTAPERARGEAGDERADVYSLAALILDLVMGNPGDGPAVTPPVPAHVASRGVTPGAWASLFDRGLATDPAARYPSVRVLYQDMLLVLKMDPPEMRPAWDMLGQAGIAPPEGDSSMDSVTAISGPGRDTRTIEIGGATTPRAIVEETRAADSASPRGDKGPSRK